MNWLRFFPHRHHDRRRIVVGAGTLAATLSIAVILLVSGKSRKAIAYEPMVISITAPADAVSPIVPELPELPTLGAAVAHALPRGEVYSKASITPDYYSAEPLAPIGSGGLEMRPNVQFTSELATFAQGLSDYLSRTHYHATVTSAFRSGDRQLEIIKDEVSRRGMMGRFAGLASATLSDKNAWMPAWQWLHACRVPVNPPADYISNEGNLVSGSLHLKGMAMDLVAPNMTGLSYAILKYANNYAPRTGGLHITAIVREARCVHLSLAR